MRKTAVLLLSIAPLAAIPALASTNFTSSSVGTTTAGFLKLDVGARAAGMGQAYSAVVDEASAVTWNPAALTRVSSKSATFMHAAYIASSYFDYAAYAQNFGRYGAGGVGVQFFSAGTLTQTDSTGSDIGSFSPNDLAVSAAYAYQVPDFNFAPDFSGMSFGMTVKYVQSRILATANTGAIDLGWLSRAYWDGRLRFAAAAANLGGGTITYEKAGEALPQTYRFGSSLTMGDRWITAVDLALPKDAPPYEAVGTEYRWRVGASTRMATRAGYNTSTLNSIDGFAGASFGLGLGFGAYDFDYGFVPFGGLGQAHRLSITFAF